MGWLLLGFFFYFLIVLSERTLIAVSAHDVEAWRSEASPKSQQLLQLAENVKSTLAALLLARLFVKILIVVFSTAWLMRWLNSNGQVLVFFQKFGLPAELASLLFYTILVCLLALGFWLIKRLDLSKSSTDRAPTILSRLAGFIVFCRALFSIFVKKEKKRPQAEAMPAAEASPEELKAQNDEKREMEMLKSIVKFSDVTVKQVMQARSKVVAVDFRADFRELLGTVRESGFSRLPVFDEDLDNVTGILYVKDLVPHLEKGSNFEWQSLIRPNVLLVPESKRISELLAEFKKQKLHMAVVVDEYGGSAGIVTMEDILEEVTGDIRDEFDEESEISFTKLDDSNYLFEGRALLNDVCRIVGIDPNAFDDARGDADTLAGLLLEINGDIPKKGAEMRWRNYLLTVIAADNRRIEQVKISIK